jgi:hypothetical protein
LIRAMIAACDLVHSSGAPLRLKPQPRGLA